MGSRKGKDTALSLQIMHPNHHRLILLKTAQRNECPDQRLNTETMGDKDGERVVGRRNTPCPGALTDAQGIGLEYVSF
jgi:hypothetical protein